MSLDRQDIRARLDHDDHARLVAICDVRGLTVAEYVEKLVAEKVRAEVHAATVLAGRVAGLGKSATDCDTSGGRRK